MKNFMVLGAIAFLAGCLSPQESCINDATRQTRALSDAIVETQGNISRGFAIHSQRIPYTYPGVCHSSYGSYTCPQTGYRTQETPVAVSVAEERVKLASLRTQLNTVQRESNAAIAQCRAQYPE